MPKTTGPEPWYRAAKRRWYVTLRGEQINLGPDEQAARAEWHRLMAGGAPRRRRSSRRREGEEGGAAADAPLAPAAVRLDQALDAFLGALRCGVADGTHRWYVRHLSHFCRHAGGGRPLKEVAAADVARWLAAHPGWSATQRRNALLAVRRAARWLAGPGGLCGHDLTAGLKAPPAEPRRLLITEDDVPGLLEYFDRTPMGPLVRFVWLTGCRPQEAMRLDVGHVRLATRTCVLPAELAKGRKRPRVIYLCQGAEGLVHAEVTGRASQGPSAPLFVNAGGGRWNAHAAANAFYRFRLADGRRRHLAQQHAEQGVEGVARQGGQDRGQQLRRQQPELDERRYRLLGLHCSLYSLRHLWTTRALKAGLNTIAVAHLLGHSDPTQVARTYSHLENDLDHLHEQLRRLG